MVRQIFLNEIYKINIFQFDQNQFDAFLKNSFEVLHDFDDFLD